MIPNSDKLLALYRSMFRIRVVEETIAERYDEDQMKCPTHLSIGQEACAVGVCEQLGDEDIIYSTHRNHAHYLAKGGDLKRMIAEMYGKETGCAKGRGGSMHLIDVERGVPGSSAIVGGSMPLPIGAAWAFKLRNEPHIGVTFFGDAGVEPGVFHECMNFAALHKLPVLFVCEDNQYSTMTPVHERQCVPIAERAQGYGIPGIRIDGNDVLKVYDTAATAIARARSGGGPTFLELTTYRWREHVEHNKGIMMRPPEELKYWQARCPLKRFKEELLSYDIEPFALGDIEHDVEVEVEEAFRFAEASPHPKVSELMNYVGDEPEALEEPEGSHGDRKLTCAAAIAEATVQAMEADENVILFGLHVTDSNGIFGTTKAAYAAFPERVFEIPIMEAGMTGIATGLALHGKRPLFVHARVDFMLLTMSQIANEMSKWSYMSGGQCKVPVVIRAIVGRSRGQGCQHSQSLQSLFAHFPGLNVAAPSNAYDAKGLLMTALTANMPIIYLEHRLCHPLETEVPTESYRIPIGKARVVRSGTDVTIVSVLQMVYEAQRAADILAHHGVSAEVIDLRSIRPWDKEAVCASVKKTGRLIVADTGWTEFGISAEIMATVTERAFSSLKAPPSRIGLPACPTPCAEVLETALYPGSRDIVLHAFAAMGKNPPEDLPSGFASAAITTGSF
ncbi:MAG: thiamine pyrophosphate-dependent enzyme [Patescibacteria group bacterium]|jgi:2-oxoisovalerate dehydrogenase E1 component